MICTQLLHHDPTQWQKPSEFIPERFESDSPYFKKPDGSQRHPMAFNAFLGGGRVCLGKTFVEVMVRFTISMLLWYNSYDFVDPEHKVKKPLY